MPLPVNNVDTTNGYPPPTDPAGGGGGGGSPPLPGYTAAGPLFGAKQLRLQIASNAALIQYMIPDRSGLQSWHYADEVYIGVGSYSLSGVIGFRARSAASGAPAKVAAEILGASDYVYEHLPAAGQFSGFTWPFFNVQDYGARGNKTADDGPAIQATINAASVAPGGTVLIPGGQYTVASPPLTIPDNASVKIWGLSTPAGGAVIFRGGSGDLFSIGGSLEMKSLLLYDESVTHTRTGAALKFTDTATTRAGLCLFEWVRISSDDPLGAWERIIDADGTHFTGNTGIRDVNFNYCEFFGCRTAGETIRLQRATGWRMQQSFIAQAPTAIVQGMKILDKVNSADFLLNFGIQGGNFWSEAHGVQWFGGTVTGNITLTADSYDNMLYLGNVTGTVTNLGTNSQVFSGASGAFRPSNVYPTGIGGATSAVAYAAQVEGDTVDRWRCRMDGTQLWGSGAAAHDLGVFRDGNHNARWQGGKLIADVGLGVGNFAASADPGPNDHVVYKAQIFDTNGASLGYLPIYGSLP